MQLLDQKKPPQQQTDKQTNDELKAELMMNLRGPERETLYYS